ncbi:sugar transferase [Rhodocaloribacter litoris]|uniref:sugar transferase n=1 Tax=Rhodocaloribacter litoris TaxID=2558931 RepID=UPI001422F9ED|nr:sugar transferase [Rhodocaloribacter litoris]QXD14332.1 sugar transferase [Rhodocaloribacter litoris]
MNTARPPRAYTLVKRLLDVLGAALLLLLLAPVLVVVAWLIFLEDGSPVLFRQRRIGRHGRPFRLLKFRTLRRKRHDPTRPAEVVTHVGRFLRRWGVDELPQLWNVLRGEMSLVGPRPALPEQVARYGPFERQRLAVRPGLTGWAQIHGRNALPWPERIRLDVWYVTHQNLGLDLRILLRTPGLLLSGRGVYGPAGRNEDFPPSTCEAMPPPGAPGIATAPNRL